MKKTIALVLSLLLLTSCTQSEKKASSGEFEKPSSSDISNTSSVQSGQSVPPESSEPAKALGELYKQYEGTKVYHIVDLDIKQSDSTMGYNGIAVNDRYAACIRSDYVSDAVVSTLVVYDIGTGKTVSSTDLGGDQPALHFLADGNICLGSSFAGTVKVLSVNGEEKYSYKGLEESYSVCADDDGGLWVFGSGKLHRLKNGEDKTVDFPEEYKSVHIDSVQGAKISFSSFSTIQEHYVYDTETGEVSGFPLVNGYLSSDAIMYKANSKTTSFSKTGETVIDFDAFKITDNSYCVSDGSLFCCIDDRKASVLDFNKRKQASAEFSGVEKPCIAAIGNGKIAFVMTSDSSYGIGLLDFDDDDYIIATGNGEKTLSNKEKENIELAKKISDKTGANVMGVGLPDGTLLNSYTTKEIKDARYVTTFLKKIDDIISKYPVGVFKSVKNDNITRIQIAACSGFNTIDKTGIAYVGALTGVEQNTIYMIFNVNNTSAIETDFAHEFMHALEDSVINRGSEAVEAFPDWNLFNPKDFTYYDRYTNDDGSDVGSSKYTWYGEANLDNVYFVDAYAQTKSMEDRARIFENMVVKAENNYFKCPHLVKKAKYISKMLKEYFPEAYSGNTPPIWENYK